MKYRRLGRTAFMVSEIGFGAWGIGKAMWVGADDEESLRALHLAADLGLSFVDTALAYGHGHSEQLVGSFVRQRQETIYVATKIPPKNGEWPARKESQIEEVFPPDHIVSATEKSLKNLGRDCIDLQQFHVWNDRWAERQEWRGAVEKLKREGKIRFMGISLNDNEPENGIQAAETGLIDSFQVIYNIFEQAPQDRLIPYCFSQDIGVIARVPFDEGSLTGKITPDTIFPDGDWRNRYFRGNRKKEVFDRVSRLGFLLHDGVETLAEAALRFCLSESGVSTVIPGMRTTEHVRSNCAASDGRALPRQDLVALRSHVWPRNFYQ
jgi:aryl-alcohol dehydrogenase-like predicted oxidoreductase